MEAKNDPDTRIGHCWYRPKRLERSPDLATHLRGMHGRSPVEQLQYLAVFGRAIESETFMSYRSMKAAVTNLYLEARAPLRLLAQRDLLVAIGGRDPSAYVAIARALGGSEGTTREVAERSGERFGSSLRRKIAHLEGRGWLASRRRYGGRGTSPVRSRIRRAFDRFYFGLVDPHEVPGHGSEAARLWKQAIRPALLSHVDRFLPLFLRQVCRTHGGALGLDLSGECGPWRGYGAFGRPVQFDLVARLEDGRLAIGRVFSDRERPGARAVLRFRMDVERVGGLTGSASERASWPSELRGDRVVPIFLRPSGFDSAFVEDAEGLPGRSAVLLDAGRLLQAASRSISSPRAAGG